MADSGRGGRALGLRAQILLGLAAVTTFAILTSGYLMLWASGSSLRVEREAAVLTIARAAAGATAAVIDRGLPLDSAAGREQVRGVLSGLVGDDERAEIAVYGPDRRVVASRPAGAGRADANPPLLLAVLSGGPAVLHYRARGGGGLDLLAIAPVQSGARVVAAARVAVPAPAPVEVVVARSGWVLVTLAVADGLLVLMLGFLLITRMVVRPLQDIERATARVRTGDWDQRIAATGPREVAALAASFNQMTASLAAQREQLIRTEKLASVGQLAAGVAHEIGNPLAAILGYVDILRREAAAGGAPLAPEERRDALERVRAETQRIHRIIQDLLEYSRPSREEAQATDLHELLRSSRALLEPQTRFRGVRVESEPVDAGAWPRAMASPSRLQQVFVNLLLNAADAMAGAGAVRVSSRAIPGGRVEVRFEDSGPGIAPDLRRKVFDPFFTTKAPGQGTGLGLAISRSIVEAYGGTLELAPTSPPGATFVVTLPKVD